ncbi:MAG: helix-turn-helix domain-containing protein [Xanthomonadales bacterium]|nr:helix-turn-helix domain-containing protein [Xanthomonadales bacterium]
MSQDSTRTNPSDAQTSPGLRLRDARTAQGWSCAEVAGRLRLRTPLIEAMEREDLAALGAPVFARGYLDSYARLLNLPGNLVNELLPAEQAVYVPPLEQTSTRPRRSRQWFDQFARRFVYVALTASIVIPVVLLATREPLPDPASLLTPLDMPVSSNVPVDVSNSSAVEAAPELVGPPAPMEQAVMASFTPFYGPSRTSPVTAAPVSVNQTDSLVLKLRGDSWVEVTGKDGSRLAHELGRAGGELSFDAAKVAHVLLGNASAVQVRLNGQEMNIGAFQRANVARFAVSSDGLVVPTDG